MAIQTIQLNLEHGNYIDNSNDIRDHYNINLNYVPKDTSVSKGYLKQASGFQTILQLKGEQRGFIFNKGNNHQYRVLSNNLYEIRLSDNIEDYEYEIVGVIPGVGFVPMAYWYEFVLIIAYDQTINQNNVYLFNVTTREFTKSEDEGLLTNSLVDVVFIGNYAFYTDGLFVRQSAIDAAAFIPDPLVQRSGLAFYRPATSLSGVVGVSQLNDDLYVIGQESIEVMQDTGQGEFTYQTRTTIYNGCIATNCYTRMSRGLIWLGGGQNDSIAVWSYPSLTKISTREIDLILEEIKFIDYSRIRVENYSTANHLFLLIHIPDGRTLCFDLNGQNWSIREPSMKGIIFVDGRYQGVVGDRLGLLSTIGSYDDIVLSYVYQSNFIFIGLNATITEIELRGAIRNYINKEAVVGFSLSPDGVRFGEEQRIPISVYASNMDASIFTAIGRPIASVKRDFILKLTWNSKTMLNLYDVRLRVKSGRT